MSGDFAHDGQATLVRMANAIGAYFAGEPDREEAISGIANHMSKFWTRRMLTKLNAHVTQAGDAGLDELPREALKRLGQPA